MLGATSDAATLKSEALRALQKALGLDSAMFITRRSPHRPVSLGKEQFVRLYHAHLGSPQRFTPAIDVLVGAARAQAGVALDRVTDRRPPVERAFYAELVAPQGITTQLVVSLAMRGQSTATLFLCRHGRGTPLSARDADRTRALVHVLSLAHAAASAGSTSTGGSAAALLTGREREVAALTARGLRTLEIASVLGTSPHTVRNQLVRIFRKLEVSSRSELAMRITTDE